MLQPLLIFLIFLSSLGPLPAQGSPNIVIIYTDDQRHQTIGAEGNSIIITPTLDALAKRSLRFSNAHVAFALCSPSRAALLTGRYGSANGVLHLNSALNKSEVTLAQLLKDGGYETALTGKWHLQQSPQQLGFNFPVYFEGNGTYYGRKIIDHGRELHPEEHCDFYCANRASDFISEATHDDVPFLLVHGTQLPHMNGQLIWDARQETKDRYKVGDMPVPANRLDDLANKPSYLKKVRNRIKAFDYGYPDKHAIQQHTLDYYSVITEMDESLAILLAKFDELDLWQNTYVFFMSDNGWMLGDHGFTSKVLPYRPSSQVPMMICGPEVEVGISDALVSNLDIFPTVLSLAGIKLPTNIHGKNLANILFEQHRMVRKAFVYEGLGNYGGALPNLTVITHDYRFIVTYRDQDLDEVDFVELYDRNNDLEEMLNLRGDPALEKVEGDLWKVIRKHRKKIL